MPNGTSYESGVLRRLQLTELEILKEAARICEQNKLQYFLYWGTLLGAIRHKGFIPWDDDIDIAMPRKDYEQFLDLCKDHLDPKYYLHCNDTDPLYWLPFAKIREINTVFDEEITARLNIPRGIFIDIYPLDNANRQASLLQKVQANAVNRLGILILLRRGISLEVISSKMKLVYFITRMFPLHFLSKLQQGIMSWNKNDDAPYFIVWDTKTDYIKRTMLKDKYLPAVRVEFEGEIFDAPGDWDHILSNLYNDYMQLPPEDERVDHKPVKIIFAMEAKESI